MSGTAIRTFSGLTLDLTDPRADSISIEDIAAGLSKVCRFGGQALRFHSVAQHAIAVALTVEQLDGDGLALTALHHDSHEAYVCDVPSPAKRVLGKPFAELTEALDRAIAGALDIERPAPDSKHGQMIKAADAAMLRIEAESLLAGGVSGLLLPDGVAEPGEEVFSAARGAVTDPSESWSPGAAACNFRHLHQRLIARR